MPAQEEFKPRLRVGNAVAAEKAVKAADKPAKTKPGKTAVVVCHGMGQQVPFQTLDQVVSPLLKKEYFPAERVEVRLARTQGPDQARDAWNAKPLPVAELHWKDGRENGEAHFYECYWAPLTEGKISLRDVLSFLVNAGFQGIKYSAKGRFDRFLFGKPRSYPLPRTCNIVMLGATLLLILSLVALSLTFCVTALDHALTAFGIRTPRSFLFSVLTGELLLASRLWLVAALPLLLDAFVSPIVDAFHAPKSFGSAFSRIAGLSLGLAVIALLHLAFTLAGSASTLRMAMLFAWCAALAGYALSKFFKHGTAPSLWSQLGLAGLAAVVSGIASVVSWLHLWTAPKPFAFESWLAANSSVLSGFAGQFLFLAHALLAAALMLFVRMFLVQYAGDVAAYVSAHTVNRFKEIRDGIQEAGFKVAGHVYGAQEDGKPMYDRVLVVGHSLGSVVAYDTLNRMLNQDLLGTGPQGGAGLDVAGRTKMLLTFGSPLDKTAFIFRSQAKESLVREAFAAAWQPLIRHDKFRPDHWINIWSPNDIISGSLEFYDPPEKPSGKEPETKGLVFGDAMGDAVGGETPSPEKRVRNIVDRKADLPIAAHTQYWNNPALPKILAAALRNSGMNEVLDELEKHGES